MTRLIQVIANDESPAQVRVAVTRCVRLGLRYHEIRAVVWHDLGLPAASYLDGATARRDGGPLFATC